MDIEQLRAIANSARSPSKPVEEWTEEELLRWLQEQEAAAQQGPAQVAAPVQPSAPVGPQPPKSYQQQLDEQAAALTAGVHVPEPELPNGAPLEAIGAWLNRQKNNLGRAWHDVSAEFQQHYPVVQQAAQTAREATDQLGAGALEALLSAPYDLAAMVPAVAETGAKLLGFDNDYAVTRAVSEGAERGRRLATDITGVGKPDTPAEEAGRFLPTSIVPIKGATSLASAAVTWLRTLIEDRDESGGMAAPEVAPYPEQPAEPSVFDSIIASAHAADSNEVVAPGSVAVAHPMPGTPEYYQAHPEEAFSDGPVQVETVGGPQTISQQDYSLLGYMGAASIGMMFAPQVFGRLGRMVSPNTFARSVADAAPGTEAISNLGDLARTYDDVNAGAIRIARRTGIAPDVVERLQTSFRMMTRAAANGLGDAFVSIGNINTPIGGLRVRTSLGELNRLDTPEVSRYLHLRDTLDDFLEVQRNYKPGSKVPIRTDIRGMTEPQVLAEINAMERANPGLRQISQHFRENTRAMRSFQSRGEFATLSPKEARRLNAEHAHQVPFPGGRNLDDASHDRGSATIEATTVMARAIRERLENEAVGRYIDTVRRQQPELFVRVTDKQLKDNPQWAQNVVTVYRRGKPEHYTTDPFLKDVLSIDPYMFSSGTASNIIHSTKRMLESTTTGVLAPWFSLTSAIRSLKIARFTAPSKGLKAPGLVGTALAVPRELLPQFASTLAEALTQSGGGWLGKVIGPAGANALAQRLSQSWNHSLTYQIARNGTIRGSVLQQQTQQQLANANRFFKGQVPAGTNPWGARTAQDMAHAMGRGYLNLLNAIHNSPAYEFFRINRGKLPDEELAAEARHLTGDPRIGGQYYNSQGMPVRMDIGDTIPNRLAQGLVQGYGIATELGRTWVPWWNYTVQGMKRIGEAYMANPAAFVARTWLYSQLPAAAGWLYNRSLGPEYNEYQMARRSEYNRTMNQYFGLPGRPPEEGIEIPRFHELSILSRMMEEGLQHFVGEALRTPNEDFTAALNTWLGTALVPPTPPAVQGTFALTGQALPMGGVMGGEPYTPHQMPFDQYGSPLDKGLELFIRAFGGGTADIVGSMLTAGTQDEQTFSERISHALEAGAERTVTKAPFVRDLFNMHTPVAGSVLISEEMFGKLDAIDELMDYYERWTKPPGEQSNARRPGEINTMPASKGGGAIADALLGPALPPESAGLEAPQATNPLYHLFAEEVYRAFRKDAPSSGGVGFESIMRRHGDLTENLRRLSSVNPGNAHQWREQIDSRPLIRAEAEKDGVDPYNPMQMRNWLTMKRQDTQAVIVQVIKEVEREFSERMGVPIKLEDLDPYGQGFTVPGFEMPPAPWATPPALMQQ